jgi:phosphatidylinositol-3,4,5-trisphosphate 3-phosphatase/dual-specificity protein phosphatase PTEN
VSKQKKRIQQDGFDLDLTYITEQIIAMGLPCTGVSGIYRNPQGEVIKFLTAYHEGQYKIYNLCARPQDQYDAEKFAGRVACYPFEDHEVPPLKMVDTLARDVEEWLKGSPDRVVCIHCLAGKGRTGLMVCAALMLQGIFKEGRDAMAYYGEKRMKNKKGVTQASQRRWRAARSCCARTSASS